MDQLTLKREIYIVMVTSVSKKFVKIKSVNKKKC